MVFTVLVLNLGTLTLLETHLSSSLLRRWDGAMIRWNNSFFVCVCRFTNVVQSNVVYTLSLPALYCYWFISKRWSYV